jgi:hypothetical protein
MKKPKGLNKSVTPAADYEIEIRLFASDPQPQVFRSIKRTCSDNRDYPMVSKWNYIVSKRLRLTSNLDGAGLEDLEQLVAEYLRDDPQETSEHFIADLARAEVIEVSIPYQTEDVGWAARLFPWENALSIVTRRHRKRSLVVVRHLRATERAPSAKVIRNPTSAMVVRSTPGVLNQNFDFRSESALVEFKLGDELKSFTDVDTPTETELAAKIREKKPDLIHLSVLDTHGVSTSNPDLLKGAWKYSSDENQKREGIILRGESRPYRALSALETADLVTAGRKLRPVLVSFATCFSASRLAPMAVASGAESSIGFHEDLQNSVSEAFFGSFYETWRNQNWDLLAAFQQALAVMWGQPESGRSGVALWSASSLVLGRTSGTSPVPSGRKALQAAIKSVVLDDTTVRDVFTITCEPFSQMNYCSLHNGRDLFKTLTIQKNVAGSLPPVEVRIELTAENETASWRQSLAFDNAPGSESIASRVRIPLGARALRRVQESVHSSLFVDIRCGFRILWQQSSDVTLLPVDEWRDTEEDRRWLPSFVLPRDPAVRQVIRAADRYLRALCDDSGAGFDGYQQCEQWPEVVDLQARAIWCALLYDFNLRYINPPPTYTKTTGGIAQRLRVPSQVLEEGRGTCIDLALLFASCLEYVGIYPVIFLISGHAFPGWWRDDRAHAGFAGFKYTQVPVSADADPQGLPVRRDDFAQWMVTGENGFRELVIPLRAGDLAALETTLLCKAAPFEQALQAGRDNLADAAIFDALVNVQRAREGDRPVTPLPIVGLWRPGSPSGTDNGTSASAASP